MYASSGAMRRGLPVEFKATSAETASATHKTAHPDQPGALALTVAVTAASGTTPTLSVVVEGSLDAVTWFTLGTVGANGYSVGSVATAPTNFTAAATTRAVFPLVEYVRTRSVIGGTTPSFTYSVEGSVL